MNQSCMNYKLLLIFHQCICCYSHKMMDKLTYSLWSSHMRAIHLTILQAPLSTDHLNSQFFVIPMRHFEKWRCNHIANGLCMNSWVTCIEMRYLYLICFHLLPLASYAKCIKSNQLFSIKYSLNFLCVSLVTRFVAACVNMLMFFCSAERWNSIRMMCTSM